MNATASRNVDDTATRAASVLYADDHELMRHAVATLIDNHDELDLLGVASNGIELVEAYLELHATGDAPDLVITDLAMPERDGVEACREILAVDPDAKIVVLTAFHETAWVTAALEAGAIGYLLKSSSSTTLVDNMVRCAHGNGVISGEAMSALLAADRPDPTLLTSRQVEVLALSASGHTRDQIAAALHISTATVKSHLSCIYERLGAANGREAAHLAREAGLID